MYKIHPAQYNIAVKNVMQHLINAKTCKYYFENLII